VSLDRVRKRGSYPVRRTGGNMHGMNPARGESFLRGVNSMVKLLRAHGGCLGRNRR
jgi:hypothetical protein